MAVPNHYDVLGLQPTASHEEIEKRAAELERLYAVDGGQSGMVALIGEASRILLSPTLRQVYDADLAATNNQTTVVTPPTVNSEPSLTVPDHVTQSWPAPQSTVQEKTQAVPRPVEPQLNKLDPDTKLASELAKRGVPADEIKRLVNLNSAAIATSKKKQNNKRNGDEDLSSQFATPGLVIPPSKAYVPKPTIRLPEFRESTTSERMEADRKLTSSNIARRRGKFQEAEQECRAALELIPKDASALEMFGDIMQSLGRVDDALYAYETANKADAKRASAEKKYAQLMLLQNREIEMLRTEYIPRNPIVAVFFTALCPGAGQMYNGQTMKGLILAAMVFGSLAVLFGTPLGHHKGQGLTGPTIFFALVTAIAYIYAIVDAHSCARLGKKLNSGWDI